MSTLKILIAAGGTGGHIYPALAIAEALRQKRPGCTIEFVGTNHGFENKIIPARGYKLHHLPVGRLNSNVAVGERLMTVLKLPWAMLESLALLRRERPGLVLGVGGHASGPLLLTAALAGYRTAIWEPNAMPGLANRWLAKFVDDCWAVFAEARPFLKNKNLHAAGMPVRAEIEDKVMPARTPGQEFHILVFGGSQGARSLNSVILEMLAQNGEWLNGIHFVHQTGSADYARLRDGYQAFTHKVNIEVCEYLHNMEERYAWADLVICRSGMGTLSELAACGKAAVLIPLPTSSDDHQRKNAESLVHKGAAVMLLQQGLSAASLRAQIESLRLDSARRVDMGKAMRSFHQPHAAGALATQFIERIEHAPS